MKTNLISQLISGIVHQSKIKSKLIHFFKSHILSHHNIQQAQSIVNFISIKLVLLNKAIINKLTHFYKALQRIVQENLLICKIVLDKDKIRISQPTKNKTKTKTIKFKEYRHHSDLEFNRKTIEKSSDNYHYCRTMEQTKMSTIF